jgi:tetratricopeptide (TPR) repeat protein
MTLAKLAFSITAVALAAGFIGLGAAHAEDLKYCKAAQAKLPKDPAGARADYKLCLAKGKLSLQAEMITHVNLANIAATMNKWPEVISEYDLAEGVAKKAGKPFPANAEMNYARGVAYAETGNLKRARTLIDTAIKAAPQRYDMLMTRMKLLSTLGETEAALADGSTLVGSGKPAFVYAGYANRSAILQQNGRNKEALADADKAIKADPKQSLAYNNRCMAAAALKRSDAIASCEKAISITPKAPSYWNSLGYAYEQAGRLKEAEAQYAKVATAQPKNKDNNEALARVRAALASKPS